MPDNKLRNRGTVEVGVQHGRGARYKYNVQLPDVMVTRADAQGVVIKME